MKNKTIVAYMSKYPFLVAIQPRIEQQNDIIYKKL